MAPSQPRGPFHVFSVYYKHGEWALATYDSEEAMRAACCGELRSAYGGHLRMSRDAAAARVLAEGEGAELNALIARTIEESRIHIEQEGGYSWVQVIEGGKAL